MLKMVDGTGIIGVDMICPLGVSTPQPPNYDRVELEGSGMLVLPNSLDAPLDRLELGGKTEQVQTTGKNLFDFSNLESGRINISTGALEEHNHTRRLADYIDITGITSFSVYLPGYNKANGAVYVVIYYYDKDKKYLSYRACGDKQEKYENIAPAENAVYIKVTLEQNTTDNPQNIFKVQLEKGAKSTDYEPYTGGKPSPSQEYQQKIKNVGKWNEGTQKYEVDVKITGKNLFDKCLLEGGEIVEFNGVECYKYKDDSNNFKYKGKFKNGQQYALTTRILRPESKKSYGTYIKFKYEDGTDSVLYAEHGGLKTLVSNIGKTIDSIIGNYNYSTDCYLDLSVTRLSRGGQDSGYQPYKEQTLTVTSDRPITKWDRLVEQGGQIGWLYGSEILQFTDAEGFKFFHNAQNKAVVNVLKAIDPDYSDSFSVKNSYCTHFINNVQAYYDSGDTCSFTLSTKDGNCLYFKFGSTSDVSDLEKFEKWILEKRPVVIYKTKDLQFIPLPQSEQNAIRALKTYYPTTVITTDGGELDPDIKVTYRKEI